MKKCLNCDIYIGGNEKSCPLCRNALTGQDSHDNWPRQNRLKKQAFFYKLQLFVVLTLIVVSVCLDFLMDLNNGRHYSIMILVGLIMTETVIMGFIRKSLVVTKIISTSVWHIAMFLCLVGFYYDFIDIVVVWVLPILLVGVIVADFILTLIDKTENAMIYLLVNVLIAIVAYVVVVIKWQMKPLVWTICLMLGIISFVGIAVFKGPKLKSEIEKRMNF